MTQGQKEPRGTWFLTRHDHFAVSFHHICRAECLFSPLGAVDAVSLAIYLIVYDGGGGFFKLPTYIPCRPGKKRRRALLFFCAREASMKLENGERNRNKRSPKTLAEKFDPMSTSGRLAFALELPRPATFSCHSHSQKES